MSGAVFVGGGPPIEGDIPDLPALDKDIGDAKPNAVACCATLAYAGLRNFRVVP